jgi:hypothetical protein
MFHLVPFIAGIAFSESDDVYTKFTNATSCKVSFMYEKYKGIEIYCVRDVTRWRLSPAAQAPESPMCVDRPAADTGGLASRQIAPTVRPPTETLAGADGPGP